VFTDGFIRHTLGDFFVVILLYSLIKTFTKLTVKKAAFLTLSIAFLIEFLQLMNISDLFPKKGFKVLTIILGSTFSFSDLVAYTSGIICILIVELKIRNYSNPST
jgi:hypothetical protein